MSEAGLGLTVSLECANGNHESCPRMVKVGVWETSGADRTVACDCGCHTPNLGDRDDAYLGALETVLSDVVDRYANAVVLSHHSCERDCSKFMERLEERFTVRVRERRAAAGIAARFPMVTR